MTATERTPAPETPAAPTRIGPYQVVRKLGAGGMGEVYLAIPRGVRPLGVRAVAVKVVRAELAAEPRSRERFRAEVAAARTVDPVYTARFVAADTDADQPWLATAYVPGPSLDAAVKDPGPMPADTLALLGGGLVEVLAAIHRAGVVHGDLKPSNVLLTPERPKVIDFGIGQAVHAIEPIESSPDQWLVGSPEFASPEQARGDEVSPASDVFSLGAVLVYAATGAPPFGSGSTRAVLSNVQHAPPKLDGVPPALLETVTACLEKDPTRRPTLEKLQRLLPPQDLEGWLGAVQTQVAEAERALAHDLRPQLARRRLLLGGAVLGAAAACSSAAEWLRSTGRALPTLAWSTRLPDAHMGVAAVSDSTVLCTSETTCAVFDRSTGRRLWQNLSGQLKEFAADEGHVYAIHTDGKLHAYDRDTGKSVWSVAPHGAKTPEFPMSTGELVLTSKDGEVVATEAASGTVRWRASGLDAIDAVTPTGDLIAWGAAADDSWLLDLHGYSVLDKDDGHPLWSRDLVCVYAPRGKKVYYALDRDMNLLALDPSDGVTRWSKPTRLPSGNTSFLMYTSDTLHLDGDTLFCYPSTGAAGATSGLLAAFDPETGASRWSVRTAARGNRGYDRTGSVVGLLDNKVLRGLDIQTGRPRWKAGGKLADLQLLGTAHGLFFCTAQNGLYAFEAGTGEQVWFHKVNGASGDWGGGIVGGNLYATVATTLFSFALRNVR